MKLIYILNCQTKGTPNENRRAIDLGHIHIDDKQANFVYAIDIFDLRLVSK